MAHVDDCKTIDIRSVFDHRGTIAFVESGADLPFEIKRLYWTFDIPSHASRAGHAHRNLQQLYVAVSGSFEVFMDDGIRQKSVVLNQPAVGLLMTPGIWREISKFSSNACLLVAASDFFDENDYIRSHEEFLAAAGNGTL